MCNDSQSNSIRSEVKRGVSNLWSEEVGPVTMWPLETELADGAEEIALKIEIQKIIWIITKVLSG